MTIIRNSNRNTIVVLCIVAWRHVIVLSIISTYLNYDLVAIGRISRCFRPPCTERRYTERNTREILFGVCAIAGKFGCFVRVLETTKTEVETRPSA